MRLPRLATGRSLGWLGVSALLLLGLLAVGSVNTSPVSKTAGEGAGPSKTSEQPVIVWENPPPAQQDTPAAVPQPVSAPQPSPDLIQVATAAPLQGTNMLPVLDQVSKAVSKPAETIPEGLINNRKGTKNPPISPPKAAPFRIMNIAELQRVSVPAQAVLSAHGAIKQIAPVYRPYTRFIWVRESELANFQSVALAMGYISRGPLLYGPKDYPVIDGYLMQVDLQRLAFKLKGNDLQEMVDTWEELQYDPNFALLITKDMVRFLDKETVFNVSVREWKIVDEDKKFVENGKEVKGRWIRPIVVKQVKAEDLKALKNFEVARANGMHIPAAEFTELQHETQSLAPVVSYDYFITRALNSIRDDGLYKEVFGGLYYTFRGIKKGGREKGTDLDALLEQLGVGNIEAGVTFEKLFEKVGTDQRAAIFRSKVTGRPRLVIWFQSPAGRETMGLVFITRDVKSKDVDIGQHPVLNLLEFKFAGSEVIFVLPNGLHGFAIVNAQGDLLDEVPIDIAADRTVPAPHHPRLETRSCIFCHNTTGTALGLQPFGNDVKLMLSSYFNAYGDRAQLDELVADTLNRIDSLYSGSPEAILMKARNDYNYSFLKATGPIEEGGDQTEIVRLATENLMRVYSKHNWETVSPQRALYELGFVAPREHAKDALWILLPPEVSSGDGVIIPEDARIWAIKQGIEINRTDWAFVYPFAAARVQTALGALQKREQSQSPLKENAPGKGVVSKKSN